jgi:tRNA1(Val) A37 N6-methylase TrmN6
LFKTKYCIMANPQGFLRTATFCSWALYVILLQLLPLTLNWNWNTPVLVLALCQAYTPASQFQSPVQTSQPEQGQSKARKNGIVYFTAVPPSPGSPTSRQNQAMVQELEKKLHTIQRPHPYGGRFRFGVLLDPVDLLDDTKETTAEAAAAGTSLPSAPPPSQWSGVLTSGMRSIRVVAFDDVAPVSDNELDMPIQDIDLLCSKLVERIDWQSTLMQWKSFGNAPPSWSSGQSGGASTNNGPPLTFHVRCKRHRNTADDSSDSNEAMSYFPPDIARPIRHAFATQLHEVTGWTPQPKRDMAMMEINVILHYQRQRRRRRDGSNNNAEVRDRDLTPHVLVEVPVLLPPVDMRVRELPRPGFKRVESWAVAKCANIQPYDVVLDPMCGRATFLVEAACFWPDAQQYIGIDLNEDQLNDAELNIQDAKVQDAVRVYNGDCRCLNETTATLVASSNFGEDGSIDNILCCPPFGRQFATSSGLYEDSMREWSRVLKPITGKMVLVIDENNLEELAQSINNNGCQIKEARRVRLGNLKAAILIVHKTCNMNDPVDGGVANEEVAASSSSINFVQCFAWEAVDREVYGNASDRGLWTMMRAQGLPALVPACQSPPVKRGVLGSYTIGTR